MGWSGVQEGEKGLNHRDMDRAEEWRGGGGLENHDGVPPPRGSMMVNCKQRPLLRHIHRIYRKIKRLYPVISEAGPAADMV